MLLTGEPRTAPPYAIRDTRVARIDKDDFDAIMYRYPKVLMSVSRTLSHTLIHRTAGGGRQRKRVRLRIGIVGSTPASPHPLLAKWLVR